MLLRQFYQCRKNENKTKLEKGDHTLLILAVKKILDVYPVTVSTTTTEHDFMDVFLGEDAPLKWGDKNLKEIAVLIQDNSNIRAAAIVQKLKKITQEFDDLYSIFSSKFEEQSKNEDLQKVENKKINKTPKKVKTLKKVESDDDCTDDDISNVTDTTTGKHYNLNFFFDINIFIFFL